MQTDNKMEVLNSVLDEIRAVEKRIDVLENQRYEAKKDLDTILTPLFSKQHEMANSIMNEPQFDSIKKMMYHSHENPYYDLVGTGSRVTGYYTNGKNFFSSKEYNNGEEATGGKLLPAFLTGTDEEQDAAVRAHFQAYLDSVEAKKAAAAQSEIEKAQALLKSAGLL